MLQKYIYMFVKSTHFGHSSTQRSQPAVPWLIRGAHWLLQFDNSN